MCAVSWYGPLRWSFWSPGMDPAIGMASTSVLAVKYQEMQRWLASTFFEPGQLGVGWHPKRRTLLLYNNMICMK